MLGCELFTQHPDEGGLRGYQKASIRRTRADSSMVLWDVEVGSGRSVRTFGAVSSMASTSDVRKRERAVDRAGAGPTQLARELYR